jgi:hypothetical protein
MLERLTLICKGRRSLAKENSETSILATADANVAFSLGEE